MLQTLTPRQFREWMDWNSQSIYCGVSTEELLRWTLRGRSFRTGSGSLFSARPTCMAGAPLAEPTAHNALEMTDGVENEVSAMATKLKTLSAHEGDQ